MLIAVLELWEKQQHWFYVSNQLPFFVDHSLLSVCFFSVHIYMF